MKDLVRPEIAALHAYEEEPQGGLNLMGNTNLFGANPAIARGLALAQGGELSEYPSLTSATLRGAFAKRHDLDESMVVTGNGSNELIDVVLRTFVSPGDTVAFHTPTFSMIPTFVRANHGRPVPVPLGDGWTLDVEGLLKAQAKVTILVRPNNPTGTSFARADVARIVRESTGIVVVDEAYVEFLDGDTSFLREVREGSPRLVVLRTLSKAHGLAGLRIGFGVATPAVAREISKVRGPFRLNAVSEAVGAAALEDDAFLDHVVAGVRTERPRLAAMLEARGFTVHPSETNFLFTEPPVDAKRLAAALAERGIWVRDLGGELAKYLRITVGPAEVTQQLADAIDDALISWGSS